MSNDIGDQFYRDVLARGLAAVTEYRSSRVFNEEQVNSIGYRLLAKKQNREAIEMFKMNVEDHPKSANVYDSLGEAYMKSGDKNAAIENYKKNLELNPSNDNAREMLKRIQRN